MKREEFEASVLSVTRAMWQDAREGTIMDPEVYISDFSSVPPEYYHTFRDAIFYAYPAVDTDSFEGVKFDD